MNAAVNALYAKYLEHTGGDKTAAASLALAAVFCSGQTPAARPLTVPEVAKFLRIRPNKVLSWIRSGRLRGYNVAEREDGRPKYRINPDDLEAFTKLRAVTRPAPKGRPAGRRIPVPKTNWAE